MTKLSDEQKRDFEAAAFRRLVEHLRERSDVQNIDLMNLAGFCRNCLSNWYREAANAEGVDLSKDQRARSSTACLMPSGRLSTRPKRRTPRKPNSRPDGRKITKARLASRTGLSSRLRQNWSGVFA